MKKTLIFTVGLMLLLFTTHCCRASVPVHQIPPEKCCFEFFTGMIPRRSITSIGATDSRCPEPAFMITTVAGKEFCVRKNALWTRVYEDAIN